MSLLRISDLRACFQTPHGEARALDGVSLEVREGESVGVVGESGSGKTTLALSILGLLPDSGGAIQAGSSVLLGGRELLEMRPGELRRIRGGEVAMVFQEPMTSLNPVLTVGDQIMEAVRLHKGLARREARQEAKRLLAEVGIPDPGARISAYPHQLSGGMRQRAMVAMGLAGEPRLLVADEPTTALDVTIEDQILELLRDLQRRRKMSLLLVSHDPGVVARICQRVIVLYAGKVVEEGATGDILRAPRHPYTRGLLGTRLSLEDRRRTLRPIPGEIPEATAWPGGCRFHPRCEVRIPRCSVQEPPLISIVSGEDHESRAACWLLGGEEEAP